VEAESVTTKISVMLVCDLHDGQQAGGAQTIRFGLDRQDYEIDACPDCARRLRGTLRPFITHARRAAARPAARSQRASPSHRARRSDLDADAVIHAYRDERQSLSQCADRFGTSRRVIELLLDKHAIARRPRGRSPARQRVGSPA
jgi:Zn-finger nucleic acid-binding protein